MAKYVFLLKYDAVEYCEVIGVFSSKKKANRALAKCRNNNSYYVEEIKLNKLYKIYKIYKALYDSGLNKDMSSQLILNAGVAYANANMDMLVSEVNAINARVDATGESIKPRGLGFTNE